MAQLFRVATISRQNPSLPKLYLDTTQREQVRQALLTKHTEVEFRLKATKSAKDFTPTIGAKLPKGVAPDGLPSELIQRIPQLADYGYAKMKDQILIVNELDGKIAGLRSKNAASATTAAIAAATHTSQGIDLSMVPALVRHLYAGRFLQLDQ